MQAYAALGQSVRNHIFPSSHFGGRRLSRAHLHSTFGAALRRPSQRGCGLGRAGFGTGAAKGWRADAGMRRQDCFRSGSSNAAPSRVVHVRTPRAREVETGGVYESRIRSVAAWPFAVGSIAPALWNNGPSWWLVELADAAAVRSMAPDLAAIAALTIASEAVGLAVFGVAHAPDHDLAVRAYCPADGIPEDPVTGSPTQASPRCCTVPALCRAWRTLPCQPGSRAGAGWQGGGAGRRRRRSLDRR